MPRLNVIILDQSPDDPQSYRYAMWADVPAARQKYYAAPGVTSAWADATATDNTNLQNGSVVERVVTQRVPAGATLTQIEAFLQTAWTAFQAQITAANPWIRYGSTWNGTAWSIVTGA